MTSVEPYVQYYHHCVPEYRKLHERLAAVGYLDLSGNTINSPPLVTLPISSWTSKAKLYSLYMKVFEYALDKLSHEERTIIEEHYINRKALKELIGQNMANPGIAPHSSKRTLYRRKHDAELHFIQNLSQYCLLPL